MTDHGRSTGLGRLSVAAVQVESRAGAVSHNVATAVRWVGKAAAEGAALIVLPELFLSGYDPRTWREQPDACDVTADDERLTSLRDAAVAARVSVVVGASVRRRDGARSVAVLSVSARGTVEVAYEKQHLWEDERNVFSAGTQGASLLLDDWNLGLGICYDGCFPEHARAASDAGALVYLCPSAYVVGSEHRRDLYYAARALDNGIYVVFAGLVGRCGELDFSGGTAVYDPQGRPVDRVESGEGMVVVELDPDVIDEARRINPYARDRTSAGGPPQLVRLTEA